MVTVRYKATVRCGSAHSFLDVRFVSFTPEILLSSNVLKGDDYILFLVNFAGMLDC